MAPPRSRLLRVATLTAVATAEEQNCIANHHIVDGAYVWPPRTWSLRHLSEDQYTLWERQGYLVVEDVVPPAVAKRAASAIREFIGANDSDPDTWYRSGLDIYGDVDEEGRRPLHGPAGMVQMFHHASFWEIRQLPQVHHIFSDLYGTERLYVTADRAHFKPPEDPRYPAWSDPGDVHRGLHWDVNTSVAEWPVPFGIQGLVNLEDTPAEAGPLRVVAGFHHIFRDWSKTHTAADGRDIQEGDVGTATAIAGAAGSLVLWHSLLPHGPGRHLGTKPRVSAYVTMLPVDAEPFLGGRDPETPLVLADSGTVGFFEADTEFTTASAKESEDEAQQRHAASQAQGRESRAPRARRLTRGERIERWRRRLPLLNEDPLEHELPRRPPGEEDGRAAVLTDLGEKLVGLRSWDDGSRLE